jgi:hypothetical protein
MLVRYALIRRLVMTMILASPVGCGASAVDPGGTVSARSPAYSYNLLSTTLSGGGAAPIGVPSVRPTPSDRPGPVRAPAARWAPSPLHSFLPPGQPMMALGTASEPDTSRFQ